MKRKISNRVVKKNTRRQKLSDAELGKIVGGAGGGLQRPT